MHLFVDTLQVPRYWEQNAVVDPPVTIYMGKDKFESKPELPWWSFKVMIC